MIRETEEKFQIAKDQRIKVVSKSGMKLVHLLEKKNPFAKNCEKDCPPCENKGENVTKITNCKVNNICYEASCDSCQKLGIKRTYIGETARNLHIRSKEHYADMRLNKKSWMKNHIDDEHEGKSEEVNFSWKVLKKHNKPLQRQLHEAVRIKNKTEEESLNSKSEYLSQRINRLNIQKSSYAMQCETCGSNQKSDAELKIHQKMFHQKIQCNCDNCTYTAIGEYDLKEHNQKSHNKLS